MRFVWFWTFWHWSKEGFRVRALLQSPLHGVRSDWDEWFCHEASVEDRQEIENAGRTEAVQWQFITWLVRHWAREAGFCKNRLIARFVLGELAHVSPFIKWRSFDRWRAGYGMRGLSSVVLGEESDGEPADVRSLEALLLPVDASFAEAKVFPEGFQADGAELNAAREAAVSMLRGKGLLRFLALWLARGRRPYPRWATILLNLGWLVAAGLIVYLLAGPEPDEKLFLLSAVLLTVWLALIVTFIAVGGRQSFCVWWQGRQWCQQLAESQVRLRMNGGLTIKGASAGLAFCLNILLSLYRARPRDARRAWLWRTLFRKLHSEATTWAATGVVTATGSLKPVILGPKLRACFQHVDVRHILIPKQRHVGRQEEGRQATSTTSAPCENGPSHGAPKLGFAAEQPFLRIHPCPHVGHAFMAIGGLTSKLQTWMNGLAGVVSAIMLLTLPDLLSIVSPPPPPAVVTPSSPSPYYLWVSLATDKPECFQVVLESKFWSNRRAQVKRYEGANASVRAEIRLQRVARQKSFDEEDGTVWVERRRHFFTREFAPGDQVGSYSFSYVSHLGYK